MDDSQPNPPPGPPAEPPYVGFLKSVKHARSEIGDNMAGFVLLYLHRHQEEPQRTSTTWAFSGAPAVQESLFIDAAALYARKLSSNLGGNLPLALQLMVGRIIERILQRGM